MSLKVYLRAAKIPRIGAIAVHYWFVIAQGENTERWEIWQSPQVGKKSWGHLHLNLMKHDQGVGNGHSWLKQQWQDIQAEKLAQIIRETPNQYPYNYCYRYYPGPNSNTYVQWILNQAEIDYQLSLRGWGKNYLKHWQFLEKLNQG
jgi:hypothetical protein